METKEINEKSGVHIYVTQPSMPTLEEYIHEIQPIFESRILTNRGPVHRKFEKLLKQFLKVDNLALCVNGHMGLELALEAVGAIKPGGEVITTPFTFISTVHAIVRRGLKPVFCDIEPDTLTIDPDKIEALITENTTAIMPVHVYGTICDVEKIQAIADKYHLKVIYDAAHTFGETYKGQSIGSYGDASVFSFHATKAFNSIEGGAVVFKDAENMGRFLKLQNFGIESENIVSEVGCNAKMDEFRAAFGICNLKEFSKNIEIRKALAEKYDSRLRDVPGITLKYSREGSVENYTYYPVLIDPETFGKDRDQIYNLLSSNNIHARKYFYPAINDLPIYKEQWNMQITPISSRVAGQILALPLYQGLSMDDIDRICDVILG